MKVKSKKLAKLQIIIIVVLCIFSIKLHAQSDFYYSNKSINIKNINGKLYAYIVLLYNENPHFVNIIQKDTIPLKMISIEGFHVKAYKNYINSIRNSSLKWIARRMMDLYVEPHKYNDRSLKQMEKILTHRRIILKFTRDRNYGIEKLTLDYCIYGKKVPISIKHPLFSIKEKIYNIQPYIYYDEFSTSNSTFYFDMIYINPVEVNNDYLIAKRVLNGGNNHSMFFVGSRVTDDIKYCLAKAFKHSRSIRGEIFRMFVVHELTHKILNNKFNNFDQVIGEELSLCSTIYENPYLGLSVLYSYLNYNSINPHRIAAMNFVQYCSERSKKKEIIKNPSMLKNLKENNIKQFSKENFFSKLKELKSLQSSPYN